MADFARGVSHQLLGNYLGIDPLTNRFREMT